MLDWAHSQVLPGSGLLNISNSILSGDWNYYDPTQVGVISKFNTVYAYALQECIDLLMDGGVDMAPYISRLGALRKAIEMNLWSSKLNAYYLSEFVEVGFAQDSNALAILADVTASTYLVKGVEYTQTAVPTQRSLCILQWGYYVRICRLHRSLRVRMSPSRCTRKQG
jgi:hypothetical protein